MYIQTVSFLIVQIVSLPVTPKISKIHMYSYSRDSQQQSLTVKVIFLLGNWLCKPGKVNYIREDTRFKESEEITSKCSPLLHWKINLKLLDAFVVLMFFPTFFHLIRVFFLIFFHSLEQDFGILSILFLVWGFPHTLKT